MIIILLEQLRASKSSIRCIGSNQNILHHLEEGLEGKKFQELE